MNWAPFRRRLWRWLTPLILVVVNLAILVLYQVGYAGRSELLQGQIDGERGNLARVQELQSAFEELLSRADRSRAGISELYRDRFATEEERFTGLIREVKELGRKAGLKQADAINYPSETVQDHGLVKRSIVFTVDGTYLQLRQFINLLELSESFISLDKISVTESPGGLNINLHLSSLFIGAEPSTTRRPARRQA